MHTLTSDAGEGNQHQVIVIAFFGHGGKFQYLSQENLFVNSKLLNYYINHNCIATVFNGDNVALIPHL